MHKGLFLTGSARVRLAVSGHNFSSSSRHCQWHWQCHCQWHSESGWQWQPTGQSGTNHNSSTYLRVCRAHFASLIQLQMSAVAACRARLGALASSRSTGVRALTSTRTLASSHAESFLNGSTSVYVEDMFHSWKANPARFVIIYIVIER